MQICFCFSLLKIQMTIDLAACDIVQVPKTVLGTFIDLDRRTMLKLDKIKVVCSLYVVERRDHRKKITHPNHHQDECSIHNCHRMLYFVCIEFSRKYHNKICTLTINTVELQGPFMCIYNGLYKGQTYTRPLFLCGITGLKLLHDLVLLTLFDTNTTVCHTDT